MTIELGFFTLGAVLLLIALLGGNFKIFGAEIPSSISNNYVRYFCFFLGIVCILLSKNSKFIEFAHDIVHPPSPVAVSREEDLKIDATTPNPTTVTPELNPNPAEQGCTITTDHGAELLSAAGTSGQRMMDLPVGEEFTVIKIKQSSGTFYKIKFNNTEGWVNGFWVKASPKCFN